MGDQANDIRDKNHFQYDPYELGLHVFFFNLLFIPQAVVNTSVQTSLWRAVQLALVDISARASRDGSFHKPTKRSVLTSTSAQLAHIIAHKFARTLMVATAATAVTVSSMYIFCCKNIPTDSTDGSMSGYTLANLDLLL